MAAPTIQIASKPLTSPYGYGLMGFTWRDNPCPTSQAFTAMRTALSQHANFWNGGEFYGPIERNSLVLLNEYFQKYPEDVDKVVLSIKGGLKKDAMVPDGSEENVRRSVLDCLEQLQANGVTKTIDLFECARVDPNTPIEDTISYLAKLLDEGKIGGISLSEVSAKTIRRAAKVHKIDAVEVELSLWSPDILKNGVAAACAESNIPIVAYSPLGRGAFSGQRIRKNADLADDDRRKGMPKFQDEALKQNNLLLDAVSAFATRKGVTDAQIALAWVRGHSHRMIKDPTQDDKEVKLGEIIPIPGATTKERVLENLRPDIVLSEEEMDELDDLIRKFPVEGDRYPNPTKKVLEG